MLHTYVEHRKPVERRAGYELEKAEALAHILEGLVKAQDRSRTSSKLEGTAPAESNLSPFSKVEISGIMAFDFTEAQSKAIAERRFYHYLGSMSRKSTAFRGIKNQNSRPAGYHCL